MQIAWALECRHKAHFMVGFCVYVDHHKSVGFRDAEVDLGVAVVGPEVEQ